MKFLVDTSALTRILREQADSGWDELEDRGLLSVCEPALAETLLIASSKHYAEQEQEIEARYLPVRIPDGVWPFSLKPLPGTASGNRGCTENAHLL